MYNSDMFHRPRLFTNKQRPAFHYAPATLENRWYNIVRGRNLMSYSEDLGADVSDEATSNPSADTPKAAKPSRLFTTIKVLVLVIVGYWAWNLYTGTQIRIQKSRCTRAYAVIKRIDFSLTKMLTDTGVENFRDLLADSSGFDAGTPVEQINRHSEIFYDLILHGTNAATALKPEYRRQLADKYMKLENDPWGRKYLVYFPARNSVATDFEKSLLSLYGAPSDLWPGGMKDLPNYCIFSAGKDGTLEIFSDKQTRGPNGDILKYGDDVSSIHQFEIGW